MAFLTLLSLYFLGHLNIYIKLPLKYANPPSPAPQEKSSYELLQMSNSYDHHTFPVFFWFCPFEWLFVIA